MPTKGTAVREVISAAGVILGLVFVGYQLQQGNAMARIEANTSAGERWLEWNMSVAADAELSALLARVLNEDLGHQDLDEGEAMRMVLLYQSALYGWQTGYQNFIESSDASDFVLPENSFFQSRFLTEIWPRIKAGFDHEFAEMFESRYDLPTGAGADGA